VKLFITANGIELHPKDVEVDETGTISTTGTTASTATTAAAAVTASSGTIDSALSQAVAPAATVITIVPVPAAAVGSELVIHSGSGATVETEVQVHDVAADKVLLRERVTKEFRIRRE
jgi:hypothetical protein